MVFIILAVALSGCGARGTGKSGQSPGSASSTEVQSKTPKARQEASSFTSNAAVAGNLSVIDRKIVKNGSITLAVKDLKKVEEQIYGMVEEYKGYILSSSTRNDDRFIFSRIEVKIPSARFEEFFSRLKQIETVESDNIDTQDVTEEYIDLDARQKVLKVQEQRLLEIMSKAQNVEDLLKVEEQLGRIRTEIEQIQGRINYLNNATDYSTVNIDIREQKGVRTAGDGFFEKVAFGFVNGWSLFFNILIKTVETLAWLSPYVLILGTAAYFMKKRHIDFNFWKGRKND